MFDRINRRHSIRYKNTNVDGIADKLKSSLLTQLINLKSMKIVGLIIGSIPMIMALCGWVYEIKDNNKKD